VAASVLPLNVSFELHGILLRLSVRHSTCQYKVRTYNQQRLTRGWIVRETVTDTPDPPANYYKLLGVHYSATGREITRAYREAMKRTHPDTVAPQHRRAAEERAKLLNLAMRTLTRPADRKRYDDSIRGELVQEQIMSHYFGGMGMPGSRTDPYGDALRREQTSQEKTESKLTTRSAMASILLVFGGITALVVCLIVVWAAVSALVHALL
jgi:hypothetical protein